MSRRRSNRRRHVLMQTDRRTAPSGADAVAAGERVAATVVVSYVIPITASSGGNVRVHVPLLLQSSLCKRFDASTVADGDSRKEAR